MSKKVGKAEARLGAKWTHRTVPRWEVHHRYTAFKSRGYSLLFYYIETNTEY